MKKYSLYIKALRNHGYYHLANILENAKPELKDGYLTIITKTHPAREVVGHETERMEKYFGLGVGVVASPDIDNNYTDEEIIELFIESNPSVKKLVDVLELL